MERSDVSGCSAGRARVRNAGHILRAAHFVIWHGVDRYAEHGKEVDCWHPVGTIMPV